MEHSAQLRVVVSHLAVYKSRVAQISLLVAAQASNAEKATLFARLELVQWMTVAGEKSVQNRSVIASMVGDRKRVEPSAQPKGVITRLVAQR
jgi:hypothetical protein